MQSISYIASIYNFLNIILYLLRVCHHTMMQFYVKILPKNDIVSVNKMMFYKIIPLLDNFLTPLSPTPLMQKLKNFQKVLNNYSNDLQLRFK